MSLVVLASPQPPLLPEWVAEARDVCTSVKPWNGTVFSDKFPSVRLKIDCTDGKAVRIIIYRKDF